MITDIETNIVYFSDLLSKNHPGFFKRIRKLLELKNVKYGLLSDTNDIWCRDYMPVQVSKRRFVQFKYDPFYLHGSKKDLESITDSTKACQAIGVKPVKTEIKIDGGNVVRSRTKVIMTERIFKENRAWSRGLLLKEIEKLLEVKRVIIIPDCPHDQLGHADGIVRFIESPGVNPNTVFVTDLSGFDSRYFAKLMKVLLAENLLPIILPYDDSYARNDMDATGIYVNYIQVGKTVIFPSFGIREDALAESRFQAIFGSNAIPLRSKEIANDGGVLNCISWNISN